MKIRRKKDNPTLMLTSLLDMFTIILIFLIVSFEAEDYEFKLNPDLKLPESSVKSVFKPAANVALTPKGIVVGEKTIVDFGESGAPNPDDVEAMQFPPLIEHLEGVLESRQAEQDERLAKAEAEGREVREDEIEEPIVVLQADKNVPYETLYLVMRSARLAGFTRFRMAVMKN